MVLRGLLLLVVAGVLLAGCAGTAGQDSSQLQDGTALVFDAAASAGDLLRVTVDPTAGAYAWDQVDGTAAEPSRLAPLALTSEALTWRDLGDDFTVLLAAGRFVVGGRASGGPPLLLAGVPARTGIPTAAEVAGWYDFITFTTNPGGMQDVVYGSFNLAADGTWRSWFHRNGADGGGVSPNLEGTWLAGGAGLLSLYQGDTFFATCRVAAVGGERLFIMQLRHANESSTPGLCVAIGRRSVSSGQLDGTYRLLRADGRSSDVVTIDGGVARPQSGGSIPLRYDTPWAGFVGADANGDGAWAWPEPVFLASAANGVAVVGQLLEGVPFFAVGLRPVP